MAPLASELELDCPCCGSTLVIDANLGRVVSHRQPPHEDKPALDDAQRILAAEAARREALFSRSVADEKGRSAALSKRFDEALQEARKEPASRPLRDFDLD